MAFVMPKPPKQMIEIARHEINPFKKIDEIHFNFGTGKDFISQIDPKSPFGEYIPEMVRLEFTGVDTSEHKTGEEEETNVFEAKVSLWRFRVEGENKEWVPRGIGTLRMNKGSDYSRIIIRREEGRTVLNSRIFSEMKPIQTKNKMRLLVQDDLSSVVPGQTQFATVLIKFETEDLCNTFLGELIKLMAEAK